MVEGLDHVQLACPKGGEPQAREFYGVAALEALAERLGDVRWDSDLPGFRRFYVDDPFGNRLELLARFPAPGSGAGTTPLTVQSAHSGHRSAGAPLGGGEG